MMTSRRNKRRKRRYSTSMPEDRQNNTLSSKLLAKKSPASENIYQYDCLHWRTEFKLKDDISVFASAWLDGPKAGTIDSTEKPDIGFYLDDIWQGPDVVCSPGFTVPFGNNEDRFVIFPCPDRGAPRSPGRFAVALKWLLETAKDGNRIEIGCTGGHGRTGLVLAGLLILQGVEAETAIGTVQGSYCSLAIETMEQQRFLYRLSNRLNGRPENWNLPYLDTTRRRPLKLDETELGKTWQYDFDKDGHSTREPIKEIHSLQDEDWEYEDWLRLNSQGVTTTDDLENIIYDHLENPTPVVQNSLEKDDAVLHCIEPPCPLVGECNVMEGECWQATVRATVGEYLTNADKNRAQERLRGERSNSTWDDWGD